MRVRDKRLLEAFLRGKNSIADELVFPSEVRTVLQPENLYHRYFLPALEHAGLRRILFHDLRHTFGSLLIQSGASIVYVKEQMGHHSIQVTVDIYGHLVPRANVGCVDQLDSAPQISANRTQTADVETECIPAEIVDLFGGPGGIRTPDQGIMSPLLYR
jgi:integrase